MTDSDFNIVFVGSREFSKHILRHVLEEGWNVSLVIEPASSTQAGATTMADVCEQYGAILERTEDINSHRITELIEDVEPAVGLCCGWTSIIEDSILDIPNHGFLGIHASDLPEGRGGAPVNWQIIAGREEVAVSLFEFVPEVDDGDVYEKQYARIDERDDISTVYDKVTRTSFDLLDAALPRIREDTATPWSQSISEASYRPLRRPEDGIIDWERPASEQFDWIRALTDPYPGAFTFVDSAKMIVWEASLTDEQTERDDGEIVRVRDGEGLDVASGGGIIRLERVQFGSGPREWGDNAAVRRNLQPGTRLGMPADYPPWTYTGIRDERGGYDFDTNLTTDGLFEFTVVGCSFPSKEMEFSVRVDGNETKSESVQLDGWSSTDVGVGPLSSGVHNIQVRFELGDHSDHRFLKVYAHPVL